jgi:hypothetical protein
VENEHTINALIRKRAEIAGQIEDFQQKLRAAVVALDNVEATLRLFAPDIDLTAHGERKVPVAHHAFRGEVTRIILETLRNAMRPMTTTEITERLMQERSLARNDAMLFRTISRRVNAALRHMEKVRKLVRGMPGPGQVKMWEIVR